MFEADKVSDYHLYIDDSGQYRSLIKNDGSVNTEKKLLLPYGLTGAVLIPRQVKEDIYGEWMELKQEIARILGVSDPYQLPIHQKLMYGKTVNQFHRDDGKKPNPYFAVDPKQRLEWIAKARNVLTKYGQKRKPVVGHFHLLDNIKYAESISRYFLTQYLWKKGVS